MFYVIRFPHISDPEEAAVEKRKIDPIDSPFEERVSFFSYFLVLE